MCTINTQVILEESFESDIFTILVPQWEEWIGFPSVSCPPLLIAKWNVADDDVALTFDWLLTKWVELFPHDVVFFGMLDVPHKDELDLLLVTDGDYVVPTDEIAWEQFEDQPLFSITLGQWETEELLVLNSRVAGEVWPLSVEFLCILLLLVLLCTCSYEP